jgi:CRISPR/Cas system CSM-associated protein Csm2 small subunit
MTKKQIKDLAKALLNEMDKEGLDMEITLDDNQLEKLADSIVDKILNHYIRQQATWYTSTTMDEFYNKFKSKPRRRKTKKELDEGELLGELAKLMTKLDYHTEREEYEVCAEIKKQIDEVNKKLGEL